MRPREYEDALPTKAFYCNLVLDSYALSGYLLKGYTDRSDIASIHIRAWGRTLMFTT